jgi:hypothetical protein
MHLLQLLDLIGSSGQEDGMFGIFPSSPFGRTFTLSDNKEPPPGEYPVSHFPHKLFTVSRSEEVV